MRRTLGLILLGFPIGWLGPGRGSGGTSQYPLADRRGFRPGAWVLRHDTGPEPQLDRLAAQGVRYTRLYDRSGLLRQSLGLDDRHVSNHDRCPQPSLAPRRRLPATAWRAVDF